jgi:hypothetical protein
MFEIDIRVEQKVQPKQIIDKALHLKQHVYSVIAGSQSGAAEYIILLGSYYMFSAKQLPMFRRNVCPCPLGHAETFL